MRGLVACALLLVACKHGDSTCTDESTVVTLQFDPTTEAADSIAVTTTLGSAASSTMTLAHTPGDATQSLNLVLGASYVVGTNLELDVVATLNGVQLGTGEQITPLVQGCTIFTMEVEAPTDAGVVALDMAPDLLPDLNLSDLAQD